MPYLGNQPTAVPIQSSDKADGIVTNAKLGTDISAAKLTAGTLADARFPATLPAISGANLTGIATTYGVDVADHWYIASNTSAGTNGAIGDSSAAGGSWGKHHSQYSDTTSVTSGSGGGKFSFPKTGLYLIQFTFSMYIDNQDGDWAISLRYTNNNWSSDANKGFSRSSYTNNDTGTGAPGHYMINSNQYLLDVTNTTNDQFRMEVNSTQSGNYVYGGAEHLGSTLQIFRMGDT